MIQLIGFDGDDTLWHSEGYYRSAHAAFEAIVGKYVDLADVRLHDRLLDTERANIKLFGYGAKGMTLSMIEAAFALTGGRVSADDLHRIVGLGKEVMSHPVALLPGIRDAVAAIAHHYPVVLVTKGDLFHQEAKIAASGLADLFRRIEIVSEKDAASYSRLLAEFGVAPDAFAMVGNSLRSDIEPVVRLGGWGIHVPYPVTWAHELDNGLQPEHGHRLIRVDASASIPKALVALQSRAQSGIRGRD